MDIRALLLGVGIGSALAYTLDPDRGTRRRALARDKLVHGAHVAERTLEATACDMANRAKGVIAATTGRLSRASVDDEVLVERVRARLGRASSHPRAIDVHASGGEVTLRGLVLASETPRVLSAVAGVRGVTGIVNELDVRETAGQVSSLQGEGRVAGSSLDLLQSRWAPATRALVGLAGVAAATGAAVVYARH